MKCRPLPSTLDRGFPLPPRAVVGHCREDLGNTIPRHGGGRRSPLPELWCKSPRRSAEKDFFLCCGRERRHALRPSRRSPVEWREPSLFPLLVRRQSRCACSRNQHTASGVPGRGSIGGQGINGSGVPGFESRYGGFVLQDIPEHVDSFEQTVLGEAVHWELDRAAVRKHQLLRSKIDRHFSLRRLFRKLEQRSINFGGHNQRQQRVFERVLPENVGERSADYRPEAKLRQGPWRVLA